ncbi:MAG: hypothetical protein JNG88_07230 [Phycisphaerales bacterium]|nr:hypothetical protein [Phycisphaerales bacterium]
MMGSMLVAGLLTLHMLPVPEAREMIDAAQVAPTAQILGYFEYKPDGVSFEFNRLGTPTAFPFDSVQSIQKPTQIRCTSSTWDYTLLIVPKSGQQPTLRIEKDNGTPGRAIFGSGVDYIILSGRWPVIETEHTTSAAAGVVIVVYPFQDSGKNFDRYVMLQRTASDGMLKARSKVGSPPDQQLALRGACVALASDEVRHSHLMDDEAVDKSVAKMRGLGALTLTIPP